MAVFSREQASANYAALSVYITYKIMSHYVFHVYSISNARHLVYFPHVTPHVRIVFDHALVGLKIKSFFCLTQFPVHVELQTDTANAKLPLKKERSNIRKHD